MKKLMEKIIAKVRKVKNTPKVVAVRMKLAEENGQFLMDQAIQFAIALGLAAICLTLLTAFLQSDLAPSVTAKIHSFFN